MFLPFTRALSIVMLGMASLSAVAQTRFTDTLAQRTQACTGCHGDQGRAGPDGYYPRLAGKPAGYLYNQLLNIRDGRRHYALMTGLLEPLTDAYLLEIAQYFSKLEVPYPQPKPAVTSEAVLARGRVLVTQGDPSQDIPACQQCHGKALTGAAPHVPGLLGLPRDYLNAQLGGWRTHQRRAQSPDCMAQIASSLSTSDVAAVTHWLASQPLPANTKPLAALPPLPPGVKEIRCGSAAVPMPQVATKTPITQGTSLGAYLARAGNCEACHTAVGGVPYAGERPIETPFGTVFSSNLTSDKATGLGAWSADDFWQAMHYGRSKDGQLLNPAFPYTRFTTITRTDSDALFAYFQTLAPVNQPKRAHAMRWPYGTQAALFAWRALYFRPQTYQPQAARSEQWNRGAYLVTGLGHCGECHSPRNALGASSEALQLSGGVMPLQNWFAPSLRDPHAAGVSADSLNATVQLLKTGVAAHGQASGPMAQVVQGSTQYLSNTDLQAMAVYLQSNGSVQPQSETATSAVTPQTGGAKLYVAHCADCHGAQGAGIAGAYPPLARNRAVNLPNSSNLIQSVLYGGFAPATTANPRPFGMPPFMLKLSDQDTALVLSYVRSAWGNHGAPVTEQDVTHARNRNGH
jgi:cytochrome c553